MAYRLPLDDDVGMSLPQGAKLLSIQFVPTVQSLMLWAWLDDPMAALQARYFRIIPTDRPIPETWEALEYLATVQVPGQAVHIFEVHP